MDKDAGDGATGRKAVGKIEKKEKYQVFPIQKSNNNKKVEEGERGESEESPGL